jgi:hypothetical protein
LPPGGEAFDLDDPRGRVVQRERVRLASISARSTVESSKTRLVEQWVANAIDCFAANLSSMRRLRGVVFERFHPATD